MENEIVSPLRGLIKLRGVVDPGLTTRANNWRRFAAETNRRQSHFAAEASFSHSAAIASLPLAGCWQA